MLDRKQETKIVKEAMRAAGLPCTEVSHGRGTAWGWLHVNIGPNASGLDHECEDQWAQRAHCPACTANRELYEKAQTLVLKVTGRTGEYDGRTNILSQ